MSNDTTLETPHKYLGHMPRTLNTYEIQLEKSWNGNKVDVCDLIDGWVRTVATGSDLKVQEIDAIIDGITSYMTGRYDDEISPCAAVDEIRLLMIEAGLKP